MRVGVDQGTGRQPVMADVARAAGVSQKTVSRVVNDAPNVRESVRTRVHEAIRELGYRPNPAARALVSRRTRVIGIIMPGTALYGPSAQLFGLERAARDVGYSVLIASTADGSRADVEEAVTRLLDVGVDGIAVGGPFGDPGLTVEAFHGVPFVSVGDPLPGLPDHLAVTVDQEDGARQAVAHLLGLGHRTVWHVAGPSDWYSSQARRRGWAGALDDAGVPRPDPVAGDWTPRSGYRAGLALAERPDVTAVFVANDHMAAGVLRAMREHGRDVPGDVSVVGFDDAPEAEFQTVPLTTVRQDFGELTRHAVAQLVDAFAGQPRDADAGPLCIPARLVVRASTGPAP